MIKSEIPKNYGEKEFAEYITNFLDDNNYYFWFNVQIPKAGMSKEVDCVMYVKKQKIFSAIEIKSYNIDSIKSIYKGKIILRDGKQKLSPWDQAADNAKKFKSVMEYYTLNKRITLSSRCLFSPIVALPMIKRNDFLNKLIVEGDFKNTLIHELSESTIFFDDFENKEKIQNRIDICLNKPIFTTCILDFVRHDAKPLMESDIDRLTNLFFPNVKSRFEYSRAYDDTVFKKSEKECLERVSNINKDFPVIIEGYAGTGKTFMGINLAKIKAKENKKVLFTCYNKTLATDLNRIKKCDPLFKFDSTIQENLFIKDIFEILSELSKLFPKSENIMTSLSRRKDLPVKKYSEEEDSSYDIWAKGIIDNILVSQNMHTHLYKYDYIVADETQDFKDYMFDLLELLIDSRNETSYIFGKNQVLYVNDELSENVYLKNVRTENENNSKKNNIERRRVYRTTDISFLIAHSYMMFYPNHGKAIDWISEKRKPVKEEINLEIEFERSGGNLPKIVKTNGEYKDIKNKLKELLSKLFELNNEHKGDDCDVMILIPDYNYVKLPLLETLNELGKKYIDYSENKNKRLIFSSEEVRICSYYSSRGLEANYVLILGFNSFDEAINQREQGYIINDLGYIVLSRAIYDTYFLIIQETETRKQTEFIEKIVSYYDL